MEPAPVQIWVDVGGTFTDCFVVDGLGSRQSTKVLSNGATKGQGKLSRCGKFLTDPHRCRDPADFWEGASIAFVDRSGQVLESGRVGGFDAIAGKLTLVPPARRALAGEGTNYELTTSWEAPVLAARWLLGRGPHQALPAVDVRLGSTRGTNALLTRHGASVALLTTSGFRDLLEIGYQDRPDLFDLNVRKRPPLYAHIVEIQERLAADGSVLVPLDLEQARRQLAWLQQQQVQSLAICLLHAYRQPKHEQALCSLAKQMGFRWVSVSHRIAPLIKAVARAETTVVDAYLNPVVQDYLQRLADQFGIEPSGQHGSLKVMTSSGGLVDHSQFSGKDSILSGPAGGVVALGALARSSGFPRAIGFDMGGTSTDVSRFSGKPQLEYESVKAGVRLMVPMAAIHTVAAGGGSICWFDGVQLRVGPGSTGSDPGPACYGRGGQLSITDLNLLLGRLDARRFPFALDIPAARAALQDVAKRIRNSEQTSLTEDALADGFRQIANQHMAEAIRSISIGQGADPREHVLVGFGGAAGQHACEVAARLGISTILDPPEAGLLSALGMGIAEIQRSAARGMYQNLEEVTEADMVDAFVELESECARQLHQESPRGTLPVQPIFMRQFEARYRGTDTPLLLDWQDVPSLAQSFHLEHQQRFGYHQAQRQIELVALRVTVSLTNLRALRPSVARFTEPENGEVLIDPKSLKNCTETRLFSGGTWQNAWLIHRDHLPSGVSIQGPGVVLSTGSTTTVDEGWTVQASLDGTLRLQSAGSPGNHPATHQPERWSWTAGLSTTKSCDPVLREVLSQRFAGIASQMGIVLEQTAISINIKERRDFSCAVFDAQGNLIANAPHVPVHLGAMGQTIQQMLEEFPDMNPGDVFVTNDPYRGGSHLPDVTVVTPVFDLAMVENRPKSRPARRLFVANRAHHAEIGGIAPGSMAPTTRRLGEEGVVIRPMHLIKAGVDVSDTVRRLLETADYPSRSPEENMADMMAQVAANRLGQRLLSDLLREWGPERLTDYMEHIQQASALRVTQWLRSWPNQTLHFSDYLDDGTSVAVSLTFHEGTLEINTAGSGPVSASNFNANPAIVTAAVMYCIRCLIEDSLPLNAGVLRPVRLHVPVGVLHPPPTFPEHDRAAVAAGNVETSQRIVDVLLGAMGAAAASQGTMNNLLLGDRSFGYYETIGGGAGATAKGPGASAVHTHMTNTRLTDVEILESRFPVRLIEFAIRHGSGGKGIYPGGNGIIRQIQALRPLEVSLVTSRRGPYPPYGIRGGQPGALGENWLIDEQGAAIRLPHCAQLKIEKGQAIRLLTPGGGGFGESP
jgi:5-oxoprolinase (ATP-hydrolysing)